MNAVLRVLRRRPVVRVSQIVIGVVFLAAALAKIGDMATFASQIHTFRIVPVWSENLVAMTLPWVELVAGLCLVLGIRARGAAILATILMVVFLVAVGQAVGRDLDIECGCFGTADAARVGTQKLFENTLLTLCAAIASMVPRD